MNSNNIKNILQSKRNLNKELQLPEKLSAMEAEGGCGVIGFCCTEPVPGKHIHEPSRLMHNRGNGKGGGIAAVGFIPGLEVKPPDVVRYFVRVKDSILNTFISENTFTNLDRRDVEDEFVNQNSFKLNHEFYVSAKKQTAFF